MPILGDAVAQGVFLATMPAVIGVLVTATLLVISRDWRLSVVALAGQYVFVATLMTQVTRVEMAAVKGLIGWVICLVFYLTEQQAQERERGSESDGIPSLGDWFSARLEGWRREGISARAAFGFMAAVLVAAAAYVSASAMPLPQLSETLTLSCYTLAGLGILLMGLSRDALRVGVGMLMFLSGFDLFYVGLEPSLVVTGLLGAISFVIALGMAYLKAAQTTSSEETGAS